MSSENRNQIPPREQADCLSVLFFWWLKKLLRTGWKRQLREDDVYPILYGDHSAVLGTNLERKWIEHAQDCAKKNRRPSFRWCVFRTYGPTFLFYGIFAVIEESFLRILQVVFLGFLIEYFSESGHKTTTRTAGILSCTGIILSSIFFLVSFHWSYYSTHHLCTHMRLAISSLIYKKVLRLSQATMRSFSGGQLITIFASDMHRFDMQDLHLNYLWVAPCQLGVVIYMLYYHYDFGLSSLGGVFLLIIFIIFQYIMGKYISVVRLQKIVATNKRMRIIAEIMETFYTIKLYAWESHFFETARKCRLEELGYIKKTMILRILNSSLSLILTKMTVFLTLLFYIYHDAKPLDARRVFITLLLYEHVRVNLAFLFTRAATDFAEISVTLKRITEFLLLEEKYVDPEFYQVVESAPQGPGETKNIVKLTDLHCKWHPNQEASTLEGINLQVEEGKLLAIVGPIGSGKSSLLSAILGELPTYAGRVEACGSISYVPQTPWLFPGTIRQNITFGKQYDPVWYKEVIGVCALDTDFQELPERDQTKVIHADLTGGQKARISLARAVYSNADIYLMDDPLNAVDVNISKHILETCIRGALKNKVVLLVTHQLYFLEAADDIAVLMHGKIRATGTFSEMLSSGTEFIKEFECKKVEEDEENIKELEAGQSRRKSVMIVEEEMSTKRLLIKEVIPAARGASLNARKVSMFGKSNLTVKDYQASDERYDKLRIEKIGPALYWMYIKSSSSWFMIIFMLFLCLVVQALFTGSDYWLEFWTQQEEHGTNVSGTGLNSRKVQIIIYCCLIPGLVIVSIFRSIVMFKICINASLTLFSHMLSSLLYGKSHMVELNSTGHGINRFSKDMIIIDELLPTTLYEITGVFFEIIGAAITLAFLNVYFLIPWCLYFFVTIYLYKIYHRSASPLKRIEANARSPVYAHTTKTLQGLTTIRAYHQEQIFQKIFDDLEDKHTAIWYLYVATHTWLSVAVDWLSILLIAAITTSFMALNAAESAEVGLAVAMVIETAAFWQILISEAGHSETEMISVERILEYTHEETEEVSEDEPKEQQPPETWPDRGHIVFKDVFVEGAGKKFLLNGVSCEILPGEKIGIVGRSGAGKSTFLNALFRVLDIHDGSIEIDGFSIHKVELHTLRSKMSVIPQTPHIFAGTIRMNLDPFDEHPDHEIWDALQETNLFEAVKVMGNGLDATFTESGWNFSDGQKQLFCLARAILKRNKILCCDEATANLDPETQTFMLRKIEEHFNGCTVISVAHRIQTLIECDKILVMDEGHIVDYGPPYDLLNAEGPFYNLVSNMGQKNAENIKALTRETAMRKQRLNRQSVMPPKTSASDSSDVK